MITLKELSLHNIVTYDNATFNLDKRGVSVIYGRNKDSGDNETQSNGAGKSKLFTILAETLSGSHPLIQGKQAVKDDFYRTDASVSITFDKYKLTKYKSGSTVKYALAKQKDGKWKELHSREPLDVLSQIFPISLDEFFTLYYIDSSRPSVLQRGTHLSRFKLFSDLFRLSGYDQVLAELKEMSKELRGKASQLQEVESQLAPLKEEVVDTQDIQESLRDVSKKLSVVQKKRNFAADLLRLQDVQNKLEPNIERLSEYGWDKDIDSLPKLLKSVLKTIKESEAANQTYEKDLKAYLRYKSALSDYKKSQGLLLRCGVSNRKDYEALVAERKEMLEIDKRRAALTEQLTKISATKPSQPKPEKDFDSYADEVARLRFQKDALTKDLEALNTLDKDACKCPTCLSTLNPKSISRLKKSLKDEIEQLSTTIKETKHLANLAETWEAYTTNRSFIKRLQSELNDLPEHKEVMPNVILSSLEAALQVEEPEPYTEPVKPSETTDLYKVQSSAETVLQYKDELLAYSENAVEEYEYKELKDAVAKLDVKVTTLSDKAASLNREYGVAERNATLLEELIERQQSLLTELKDLPLLKILESAYSPKGLKNTVITNLCAKVQANLNLYAPLLYAEPVTFALDVSETQLNILITRTFDGRPVTCDVRRLSGAESRQFNLLFPMALLPLVPSPQRLNVIILDEPTANLDEAAIDLFATKFLPKLNELVPHVIVLSPNPLPIDTNSIDSYLVTREHGVSTLSYL